MKTSAQKHILIKFFALFLLALPARQLFAQAEFKPWGNIDGIRVKGQLMPFNTKLVVVFDDWSKADATGKEKQKPKYTRGDGESTVVTQIDSLHFTETVKDAGKGKAKVIIRCVSGKDIDVQGVYFDISLPANVYAGNTIRLDGTDKPLDRTHLDSDGEYLHDNAKEVSLTAANESITIEADNMSTVIGKPAKNDQGKSINLYLPICQGRLPKDQTFERDFEIKVSGDIDDSPVTMRLDTTVSGRTFAGFGGNFRIQNSKLDPEVIDYCLRNMRVAWGRVEMPWSSWQPDSTIDPMRIDTASQNIHVRRSMAMAARLGRMNIPFILTAWFPPQWAVEGKLVFGRSPEGIWGNPLNKASMPSIYRSITNYILYLKKYYGAEPVYFSFNESDLGINVRQTGEEHDELIKGLGAYFASVGLKTKLLLGDNSDANTYQFIYPAMNDPEAKPYIGAISFHSWRGWETPTLQKWADAAKQTGLPLIVGEGSIDAAAWGYPDYFLDPSYAIEEINLYTRLLAICQPLSILQWQLTSDYSPLKGGGIFGNDGPLEPTQRFWNLKQLSCTPKDLVYMPVSADKPIVSCAAMGDNEKHVYTIHIVNNGAARNVHLTGLPNGVKDFAIYVTDEKKEMKRIKRVKVENHSADFKLDERCFTSLFSE
ncbi:MAG TPA: hypothetical protein VHB54_08920 [Mucilaginibacter sp.]|nr:hypothetical protein [Mucilaginibacter sp.]